MIDFPSWHDERKMMQRGRLIIILLGLIVVLISLVMFQLRFDFSKFWIFKIGNKVQVNVPYLLLICGLIFLVYVHVEPFMFKVQRYTIMSPRLPVKSLKIAHISDTHVHYPYPQVTLDRLNRIVAQINREEPDIVVVTGDLMSDGSKYASKDIATIANSLRNLNAPIYVCFGNHDVECHEQLISALEAIGATPLEQKTVEVKIKDSVIYLSGLKPSLILSQTNAYIDELKSMFDGDLGACHILLAHMPDAADAAAKSMMFDMQLSGHSHGGQCVLPMNGGTPLLPPGCLKYHACVTNNYKVGDMVLHISRGVGVTPLPYPLIRFLCPPEISILTLVPPSA